MITYLTYPFLPNRCSVCKMRFRLKSELKKHYPVHFTDDASIKDLNITHQAIDQAVQNDVQTEKPNQSTIDTNTYKIDKPIDEPYTQVSIQSLIDKQIDIYSKPEDKESEMPMNTQTCIIPDILPDGGVPKVHNKFMITVNQDGMIAINIAPEGR